MAAGNPAGARFNLRNLDQRQGTGAGMAAESIIAPVCPSP
jgi:hypothetical protein